jgi:hypothetical protein
MRSPKNLALKTIELAVLVAAEGGSRFLLPPFLSL